MGKGLSRGGQLPGACGSPRREWIRPGHGAGVPFFWGILGEGPTSQVRAELQERRESFSIGMALEEQRLMWVTSCPGLGD